MTEAELHPSVPDDFDRRSDQAMWTGQYEREGEYPNPQANSELNQPKARAKSVKIPVRGHLLTQIADNGRPAEEINQRLREETELRREGVTEVERLTGAEAARRYLEDHQ